MDEHTLAKIPITVNRSQLVAAAVYGYLVHDCLSLYEHTARDIERHWGMDFEDAYALGIRSVPDVIGNLISASACAEKFGSEALERTLGFYQLNRLGSRCVCHEWTDLCVCALPAWRLDIDFCWSKRGLLLPVRNERRWIVSLKVFRHAQDQRPFTLKVRGEDIAA